MPNNSSPKQERLWPTLILGLGGSGSDIVRYAKYSLTKEWRKRLPKSASIDAAKQELPGIIQFLAVDTVPFEPAPSKDLEARLEPDEYVYMGGFNAAKLIANLDQHPLIKAWWPATSSTRFGRIHSGARQVRIVGRLAFYRKYHAFWSSIAGKLQLARIAQIQRAEDAGYTVVRETGLRQIYIVCSVCGGTGAGMLLDTAHRLREAEGERAIITGILLMPSVFLEQIQSSVQKSRIMSNAYATLKELEYFVSGNEFTAAYPNEAEMKVTRPFDRVYLVENKNMVDEALSDPSAVQKMVADFLYLSIMTRVGMTMNERDVNISTEVVRVTRKDDTARTLSRSFGAFGVSRLTVDEARLQASFDHEQLMTFLEEKVLGSMLLQDDINSRAAEIDKKLDEAVTRDRPSSDETEGDRQQRDKRLLEIVRTELNRAMVDHGLRFLGALVRKMIGFAEGDEGGRRSIHRHDLERLKSGARGETPGWLRDIVDKVPLIGESIAERMSRQDQQKTKQGEEAEEIERIFRRWDGIVSALGKFESGFDKWRRSLDHLKADLQQRQRNLWDAKRVGNAAITSGEHVSELVTPDYAERFVASIRNQSDIIELRKELWDKLGRQILDDMIAIREDPSRTTAKQDSSNNVPPEQEMQYRLELRDVVPVDNLLQAIGEQTGSALSGRYFDVLSRLDKDTSGQARQRFTQFLARCEPFGMYNYDESEGFNQGSLEPVRIVGINHRPNDDLLKQVLGDKKNDYEPVSTGDPSQIIAVNIVHGISPYYLRDISTYYEQYKVYLNYDEPVHLDRRWSDDLQKLALSKLEADELQGKSSS